MEDTTYKTSQERLAGFVCLGLDCFLELANNMPQSNTMFRSLSGELPLLLVKTFIELCPQRLCSALSAFLSRVREYSSGLRRHSVYITYQIKKG